MAIEMVILGGGCFWCLEAVYQEVKGVQQIVSGYTGGHVPHPSYELVCQGTTGHAEVVQIRIDTSLVTFREILEIFFTIHDPTTLNRQGNDIGTQYRSVIYTHSPEQEAVAKQVTAEMAIVWDAPIVTQVVATEVFYAAEDVHQNYFRQHPHEGYCAFVVAPKIAKLRKVFASKLNP